MSVRPNKPRIPDRLPYSLARAPSRFAACLDSAFLVQTTNASAAAVLTSGVSASGAQTTNASTCRGMVDIRSRSALLTTFRSKGVICADD